MRYPADPARILAWGLRRLAQRTARPRQLNPTTNHESQLHRRDSIDHDSRRSPAVFNLSVHSNTGGRLRLYLDLDRHAHGPESRDLARHQEPCRQWRGRWKGWRGGIRPWPRDSSRKDAVGNEQHHGSGTERLLAQTGAVALEHHREIEKDARESKPPKHLDRDISNVVSRALGAGTIEEPREVHIRRTANIEQDGCANHVVPLLLKKNSHDKQGGSTSTTRSTTGTEGESAVIYAEPDTANADFSVTRQADPCRDQSAVQTSNVVQTSQYSDEPEPSAPLANVISTSGRAGEPLEPTTAPEYSHEAPARTPRAKPRFRSCKSKYKANVHQKLLDPVSRSDAMEGSIYIFRHASADGMVKIGCTLQPVARRLQNWTRSCGEEAVLVHATGIMEFARRAEALIHQELGAERREEPLCRGCGRAHNEWFKIASGRARQVVDDWARIVYRHGLYDADRQLDASWARVLRTLRWENVDITAHSLLRRYEELMADKSSNDVVEADRGKVVEPLLGLT
ncbi:GIY-YIG nuclease family protein [Microdochium nivale]|nr:GIY-YIG nuclease family protein [Microdochium nivale]